VRLPPGRLSKLVVAVLRAFQKRNVYRQPICRISKPARLPFAGFQKLSVQLQEIGHPIGAKDFNSPVLKIFSNFKSFWHLTADYLSINIKLKAKFKKN
jgi:hypothetical protein